MNEHIIRRNLLYSVYSNQLLWLPANDTLLDAHADLPISEQCGHPDIIIISYSKRLTFKQPHLSYY
jgi:hypothetical protein